MKEEYNNKKVGNEDFKEGAPLTAKDEKPETVKAAKRKYHFPAEHFTVEAASLEEATAALQEHKANDK